MFNAMEIDFLLLYYFNSPFSLFSRYCRCPVESARHFQHFLIPIVGLVPLPWRQNPRVCSPLAWGYCAPRTSSSTSYTPFPDFLSALHTRIEAPFSANSAIGLFNKLSAAQNSLIKLLYDPDAREPEARPTLTSAMRSPVSLLM